MATPTSSSVARERPLPTGAGFQNPKFAGIQGDHHARIIIYGYTPSLPLCIVALILFTLATATHTYLLRHHRLPSFLPLTLACLLETIGYIFRTLSSQHDPYNVIWFVVQYFMIVVAPVFISASIYVCINRYIKFVQGVGYSVKGEPSGGKGRWWLRPKGILWGFITADAVTTIMQVAGAAIVGSSSSRGTDPTTGNNILLAGLAMQTFSFTIFLAVFTTLRISISKDKNVDQRAVRGKDAFVAAVVGASLLVYLRTVFRLAETSDGLLEGVATQEVFFGCLEFAPVVGAVGVLAGWHPGGWLPRGELGGRVAGEGVEGDGLEGKR